MITFESIIAPPIVLLIGRPALSIWPTGHVSSETNWSQRFPETLFPHFRGRGPTLYPVACAPQAWSSGTFVALLQASLGIEQDPFADMIRFRNPKLPSSLDSVVLRGLKVGTGSVDLSVKRHGNDSISLKIIEIRGDVQVTALFFE
jgi:hypothetical protein